MAEDRRHARIPLYGLICIAVITAALALCYWATHLFLPGLPTHVMTCPLDARIPFSPPWVAVYFLSFPFWLQGGLHITCQEKPRAYRFTAGCILALLISGAVFLIWPGTMERPEVTGTGFFDNWVRLLYRIDTPTNLFPSLHVLLTYCCWRGTLGCERIPRWYRGFAFVFFLLVCCTVLLVKQHAIIDVPAGIVVGELALQCARIFRLERIPFAVEHLFHKE